MMLLATSTPPADLLGGESETVVVAPKMRTSEIDAAVLERARSGDRDALEAFIRHYERMVFAFLGRALGRHPEVEDLAQEVFLRAYRALPRFEKRSDVRTSTWLLTIAARLVLDEHRRRHPILGADFREPIDWTTPEVERTRRALGLAIEEAASALPEDQRISFVLAEFHGLGVDEIASATGAPPATVKTRLFRARGHLREHLERIWKDQR